MQHHNPNINCFHNNNNSNNYNNQRMNGVFQFICVSPEQIYPPGNYIFSFFRQIVLQKAILLSNAKKLPKKRPSFFFEIY